MDFLEEGNVYKINGIDRASKEKFFKFRGTYMKGFGWVSICFYHQTLEQRRHGNEATELMTLDFNILDFKRDKTTKPFE